MTHRIELEVDDAEHRWLVAHGGGHGPAAALRRLLADAVADEPLARDDPFVAHLLEGAPATGAAATTVTTLDADLYGP